MLSTVLQGRCVVYVDLFSDVDGGVAEAAGDAFGWCAVLDEGCGVCVAEGMRVESFLLQHVG